jgi:GWxTD domain-containing protein
MPLRTACALFVLLAAPAAALSPELAAWGEGPASFLMTAGEREQWSRLADDDAARAFVVAFWNRRDPKPETPENEVRLEFQRRVAWAEQHLSTPGRSGAMSDRGRVLIVLGPPSEVQRSSEPEQAPGWRPGESLSSVHHPPDETHKGQGGVPEDLSSDAFDRREGAPVARRETWIYAEERAPATTGRRFVVRFHRSGAGVPELAQREPVLELLAAEVERRAARPR